MNLTQSNSFESVLEEYFTIPGFVANILKINLYVMKLSIITCTYNSEKYLQQCIDSVIVQNLNPGIYEHVFVDGNSTDGTVDIIKKYQKENPGYNIKIHYAKPKGVYNAMNVGIKISKGAYLLFLNGDDFLELDVVNKYLDFIKNNPDKDIFYGQLRILKPESKIQLSPGYKNLFLKKILFFLSFNTLVYHPSTIVKKLVFNRVGYFDETKKIASDYGFWLACIKNREKFSYFNQIVSNFRDHDASLSNNPKNYRQQIDEIGYFRKKYFGYLGAIIHYIVNLLYY